MADAFLEHHLGGPQHPLVLAVGEDDALALAPGRCEHRPHDQAGAEDEAVELARIGVEVGDRPRATPLSIAALATAGAIRRISRWSKGDGIR